MNTPRYSRFWYLIGFGLTLVVVVASLVPSGELPHLVVSDKVEHFTAYFGLAVWFGGLLLPRRYLLLGLGAAGPGRRHRDRAGAHGLGPGG